MAFLTSNLVQNILVELGQVDANFGLFTATGGSAITFINTAFANFENPPEQDAFKNYLAIVNRTAGGAGASPEGKWSVVSAYNDTNQTGTIATVTDVIASGDTIMLAKQDKFPLQQVLFAINKALEELGDLPNNADTSLTTVVNQTEYSIPVSIKRGLKQVWVQGLLGQANNNRWHQVFDSRNELTGAGTSSILYLPYYPSGRTIRLIFDGIHPVVSAYNSPINEYVHPQVATAASIVKLLQWYNRRDENQDPQAYFLSVLEEYIDKFLPIALEKHPITRNRHSPKYSVFDTSGVVDPNTGYFNV